MNRLVDTLLSLNRDQRGGSIVMMAVMMAVFMGVAALVVDMGFMYAKQNRLQIAADAAALAAASQLPDTAAARTAAVDYAGKNMSTSVHGNVLVNADVVFGSWDESTRTFTSGGTPANAVSLTTRQADSNGNAADTFFGALMGFHTMNVSAAAMASAAAGDPGCIIALDTGSTAESLSFNSMDLADLGDCTPVSNSSHGEAIKINSLDTFRADSLYSAGGYDANSIGSLDLDEPAQTNQPPLADPFAGLAEPSPGPCDYTNHDAGSSISPGVYCGDLNANGGSLTVNAGTYYIVDGDLNFNSLNTVTCNCPNPGDGVTFVLTGTTSSQIGKFDFNSIDTMLLRAPSDPSYDYPGMLIYVDRDAPFDTSIFNSIDNLTFNGAVYVPSQQLSFNSIDYTAQTDCALIVGFRVSFNSMDAFGTADNCAAYGTTPLSIGGASPRLVN